MAVSGESERGRRPIGWVAIGAGAVGRFVTFNLKTE